MSRLPPGKWSMKFDCCQVCGTTEIEHKSLGMCVMCYRKQYNKENKEHAKQYYKKYYKQYHKQRRDNKRGYKLHDWSMKFDCCQICGTTEIEHSGNGMCSACYHKKYYRENRERSRQYNKKYYQENRERFKKYYRENKKHFKLYNEIYYRSPKMKEMK